MKNEKEVIASLILRYGLILLVSLGNLAIFYLLFKPLTFYTSFFLFDLFYTAKIACSFIVVNNVPIELVSSCIAGSAYYLLFALNLALPKQKTGKILERVVFAFACFFILNILRIFALGSLYMLSPGSFPLAHEISWYMFSLLFVVGIWFLEVKIFSLKHIPFYSDFKDAFQIFKDSRKNS